MARRRALLAALMVLGTGLLRAAEAGTRLKDLARVGGWRDMELVGYGLVTGLRGTGDRPGTNPTSQSLMNLLNRLGVSLMPQDIASSNVAAVAVTARVPAFARPGAALDARVSSIGTAVSLENGTLLLTPLVGSDGKLYALAQGPLAHDPEIDDGRKNAARSTTVVLPSGVLLEQALPGPGTSEGPLGITLHTPDFTTAERIAQALRTAFRAAARAVDPARVEVEIPSEFKDNPVAFAARIEMVAVGADEAPRVVVNQITGTVVAGHDVKISPVTIAHAGLKIEIGPAEGDVTALVSMLDQVGAKPRDVSTIFRMLKRLGALKAELVVL